MGMYKSTKRVRAELIRLALSGLMFFIITALFLSDMVRNLIFDTQPMLAFFATFGVLIAIRVLSVVIISTDDPQKGRYYRDVIYSEVYRVLISFPIIGVVMVATSVWASSAIELALQITGLYVMFQIVIIAIWVMHKAR